MSCVHSVLPVTKNVHGQKDSIKRDQCVKEPLNHYAVVAVFILLPVSALSVAGSGEDKRVFTERLVAAAMERTRHHVRYDGSYKKISYPMGDVPDNTGVCTDVIIRSYRAAGIDLQREVHQDMAANFDQYPKKWGLKRPDPNIDHRRVPNLQTFFRRKGIELPVSDKPGDYRPGDLVTWTVPPALPHIGIVVNQTSRDGRRPLVVHNIGRGPELEDMLFKYPVTGVFRYPK